MTTTDDTEKVLVAGRYRLDRRIGSGGMGVVWEATDEKLRRTVAIKELLAVVEPRLDPDGRSFDEARDRIQREARIAARLQHPNVISVYDVALHDDRPWLVMEYLPSRSLDTVLAERGPLPPREVAEIGRQAAAGLAAAHGVGVVHRDIKPGNVLLADNGNVKIVDFGVSRAADEVQLTRTGLIAGTPAYLAPEVARGQTPTPASDVFALGATLYAAVEGEPPFGLSDNAYALLHTVAGGNVRPPTNAGPLTAVLMRLLRADPAERPTAQAAQNELTVVADRAPMTGAHSDREATVPVAPAQEAQAQEATVAVAGPVAAGLLDPVGEVSPPRPSVGSPVGPAAGPPGGTRLDVPAAATPGASSRRRPTLIALAVIVAVLAVAAVLLATLRNTDGGQATAASPPASSAPASTPDVAGQTPAGTGAPAAPAAVAPTAVAFVQQFYALLPGNVDAAWARLGPTAQSQSGGFEGFRNFYARMSAVGASEATAVNDGTVRATIRFDESNGRSTRDLYEFTVVPRSDGNLHIQSFRRLGSAGNSGPGSDNSGSG